MAMTRQALRGLARCQYDSFLRSFRAHVVSCEPNPQVAGPSSAASTSKKGKAAVASSAAVLHPSSKASHVITLDDTILFPEGGGQPSDQGVLAGCVNVLHVCRESDGLVKHYCDGPLESGAEVDIELDWTRRFDHMQQHSGQHLISALAETMFQWNTSSWTLGKDRCNVEFDTEEKPASAEQIESLELRCNQVIRDAVPVAAHVEKNESDSGEDPAAVAVDSEKKNQHGEKRVVRIGEVDNNPCCGTHVTCTSQLQAIKLLSFERARGGKVTRVWFVVGNRVLSMLGSMNAHTAALTKLLSGPMEQHLDAVQKLQLDLRNERRSRTRVETAFASATASRLHAQARSSPDHVVLYTTEEFDNAFIQAVSVQVEALNKEMGSTDSTVFLSCTTAGSTAGTFVIIGPESLLREHGKEVSSLVDGKGGGRGQRFQGRAADLSPATLERVRECLTKT
mmetsp:Transcript_36602/g.91760  ORF Transcript_36602/g.91760 Transcript_36602/m.91760 type:complete len:452 (-) Transcript_36602:48-1403(-)|eukprot:CAMPEP_0177656438 /NCGR_PEP_ID=MMETSP0447-20121125/15571_1 /TAXON_ID=0 /ORGANISM="Stygamoeba regulata, Strain BSH-02190019" /LENGTH=451 /DNA_ID=CAMNT_0019160565 /DNA_START=64 /DNA_END=1419 /DNA_ORIENTATION=+